MNVKPIFGGGKEYRVQKKNLTNKNEKLIKVSLKKNVKIRSIINHFRFTYVSKFPKLIF